VILIYFLKEKHFGLECIDHHKKEKKKKKWQKKKKMAVMAFDTGMRRN
jgi:hypothetical protein